MTKSLRSVLSFLLLGTVAACSSGSDNNGPNLNVRLFGTTFGDSAQLVELDPNTGALLQTIGPVGYRVNGLEYDHTTGKLFATTSYQDLNFPSGLIEIDMATGAGTEIGPSGLGVVLNPTVNSAGQMYAWTEDSDDLVRIDKSTGAATLVGAPGSSTISSWEHGLAFDGRDRLIFVNGDGEYFQMDTATGVGTSLGTIGRRAHHGDFHPGTGLYWGIDETSTGPKNLYAVDFTAQTMSFPKPTVADLFAITFTR